MDRSSGPTIVTVPTISGVLLDILVENRGRTCYTATGGQASHLTERSGIFGGAVKIMKTGEELDHVRYQRYNVACWWRYNRTNQVEQQKYSSFSTAADTTKSSISYCKQFTRNKSLSNLLPRYIRCTRTSSRHLHSSVRIQSRSGLRERLQCWSVWFVSTLYISKSAFNTETAFNAVTVLEMTASKDSDEDATKSVEFVDQPWFWECFYKWKEVPS